LTDVRPVVKMIFSTLPLVFQSSNTNQIGTTWELL
jgi:hypothetical protein